VNRSNRSIILSFLCAVVASTLCFCAPGPVVLIIGTRPEAIKMIPVYKALQEENIPCLICSTGQHTDLLLDIFDIFDVHPDYSLNIMKPGQDLFHITTSVITKMKECLIELKPSLVLVQGDTTSAMAAALAAFYLKIPLGHIEAGLRTGNIDAPYPEEMNRRFISLIARYHFAPTKCAQENLLAENVASETIFCVGNTVIDALAWVNGGTRAGSIAISPMLASLIDQCKQNNKKIMILTAHRRESFDGGLLKIFHAIKRSLEDNPNLFVIYPMHPNPIIKQIFTQSGLDALDTIVTLKPLAYPDLVYALTEANLIATDSGGIQEEGVSLGKKVLILRNETDRPEGIYAGIAQLVGTDEELIYTSIQDALAHEHSYRNTMVYGDGTACQKIAAIVKEKLFTPQKDKS